MTEEQRLMLLVGVIVFVLVSIARWPSLLGGLISKPAARCRDGLSRSASGGCGTCSHHGGVAEFLPA